MLIHVVQRPKNEVNLLSNEIVSLKHGNRYRRSGNGLLRSSGSLVAGYGPRAYAFYDSLALLESSLIQLALDRAQEAGFRLIVVPDLLTSSVIQRCGFPTSGERSQVIIMLCF